MLTTEISTIYNQDKKISKIHHVLHVPSLNIVEKINEEFQKMGGDLGTDGRLMLKKSSPELVERLMKISCFFILVVNCTNFCC
jgi:PHP family Zn ribbon phosphoesterase